MGAALDQNLGTATGQTGTSWGITTSAAAAANTRIILFVSWFSSTSTVTSASGGSLTWVIDKQSATDNGEMICFLSADCPGGLASSTTITLTISGSLGNASGTIAAASFTGLEVGSSGYLSGTPPAPDTVFSGTVWTTPNINTANDNALLVAISSSDGTTPISSTVDSPATLIHNTDHAASSQALASAYQVAGAAGTYFITGDWSAGVGEGRRGIVAYKEAAVTPAIKPNYSLFPKFLLRRT